MPRILTPEQRARRNERRRARKERSKPETTEQRRARKQRRIQRLYNGDWGKASRERRKRECEISGRPYMPRGTLDEIAKRVEIKRLIKLLRRRVRAIEREEWLQHRLSEAEVRRRREHVANRHRHRYSIDPRYAIYHRVKRNIHKHLRDGKASRNWAIALGWTMDQLKAHLERQFVRGMGWHNRGAWHIDHIRPASSFTFTCVDDPQFRECYALSNLRPLWGPDNMKKLDKRLYLL